MHPFPLNAPSTVDQSGGLEVFGSKLRNQLAHVKALIADHLRQVEVNARLAADERARRAQAALEAEKNAAWANGAVAFGLGALVAWLANSGD